MNISFIGLGAMGTAMVERLLLANYSVTVFNRTPEKTLPLVKLGAKASASIAAAVANADVVMTCVLYDQAALDVTRDMLTALQPGAIHIGLSTILPETAEALQKLHATTQTHYVAGAVLGVPVAVRAGKLTAFCAGNPDAIETVTPLLATFAEKIIPMGDEKDIKYPNFMKICTNYSLVTALELMSELYVFAEKSGIEQSAVKMVLEQIYAHPAFRRYIDKIAQRDFDNVNFAMAGGQKDVKIFVKAFTDVGVKPELGNILHARFQKAMVSGLDKKDWSGIYEVVRAEADL
ncbi:MAG: NAD(P)-dependent oxidoreductase [Gammaproteobacteria bacterium]|nr:NAD(P)-dependent oxidoreductase [Gammaproteobacteria bacterium]